MPDLSGFARKHARTARRSGVRCALRAATGETLGWLSQHLPWGPEGRSIWDDDYDICLVADACRADLWAEVSPEYPWLTDESEWSVGSASAGWYGETFAPDTLPDERIGVVTANPFAGKPDGRVPHLLGGATPIERHEQVVFADHVYRDAWGCEVAGGHLDVTHPSVVTDRAYAAWTQHDLDRLVVHYMQPHLPFRSRPEWFGERDGLDTFGEVSGSSEDGEKELWLQVRDGERDADEVWTAYGDNLRWVLDDIDRLRRGVDAELLLTSDHGNAMGELGIWGHPPNIHMEAVRRVPWVHVDGLGGDFEPSGVEGSNEETTVEEQLEALGYR